MTHYFTDNSDLDHKRRELSWTFQDRTYSFVTDKGVFSNTEVDQGSALFLKTLVQYDLGKTILDVGCGYGVLGIVLATLKDAAITMVDVNPRAVQCTQENALRNSTEAQILVSDLYENVQATYDTIISNPPIRAGKALLHRLFDEARNHLNPQGSLWLVIRRQQGAESTIKYLETLYPTVEVLEKKKGYWMIRAKLSSSDD